jgi:hypothetical protein
MPSIGKNRGGVSVEVWLYKGERMSKNKQSMWSAQAAFSARRARVVLASFIVLTIMTAGAMLAQVNPKKKEKGLDGVSPATPLTTNLAKEYIYSGERLVATVEPTASPSGDDAQYFSQSLPDPVAFGEPGQSYPITVKMINTGNTKWTPAGGYKLGSQNPANNTIFLSGYLASSTSVCAE